MNLYPSFPPRRTPKLTSKTLQSLLPEFLKKINKSCYDRHDLIPLAWPGIIGEKLAPMTRAESFNEGVLYIRVFNSTLLSILTHRERKALLKKFREKFPKTDIKEIRFRLG